jgi:hypothetical protein
VRGRKLRVDTTVVEANIHYPTDSSLLGDGARWPEAVMLSRSGAKPLAGFPGGGARALDLK